MFMTDEGLELIRQFEGFRSAAYRDPVGVWTIGYGHTSMAGAPEVKPGLTVSDAEAAEILARDVDQFARGVRALLKVDLSDGQFSALVSFAYNVGLGALKKSSVLTAVNARDFAAVPRRLQLWTKAGGHVLPGLVKRRAAEAALFASASVVAVQPDVAKPVQQSKTVWSAALVMLLAVVQAWLSASAKVAMIGVLLLMAAGLALIVFERVKKLKQEGL
jgi:GH24 family phage-related lysozyme (muramidase)